MTNIVAVQHLHLALVGTFRSDDGNLISRIDTFILKSVIVAFATPLRRKTIDKNLFCPVTEIEI